MIKQGASLRLPDFIKNNYAMSFALIIMLSFTSLVAFKNIEIHKKEIAATLQKNNPSVMSKFNRFCVQYDQLVIDFFDANNNLSLAQHIQRMEKDLAILGKTSNDIQFSSVRSLLIDLYNELQDLVTLLKHYSSSKNSIGLGFKVRRFKKLLPAPINERSEFSLFFSLNHRLHC